MRLKIFYSIVILIGIPLMVFGLLGPGGGQEGILGPRIWYLDDTTIKTSDSAWDVDLGSGDLDTTGKLTAESITAVEWFLTLGGGIAWDIEGADETWIYVDNGGIISMYGPGNIVTHLDTTGVTTADKTFTFPNISGTFVTTNGALSDIDIGAYDLTVGGDITISSPIPILVFKDNTYVGDTSLGYMEWRDRNNTRLGFFGNASSGNDDLFWKNESSGGHILIQTTGAGEFQIFANTVLTGLLEVASGGDDYFAITNLTEGDILLVDSAGNFNFGAGSLTTTGAGTFGSLTTDSFSDGTLTITGGDLDTTGNITGNVFIDDPNSVYTLRITPESVPLTADRGLLINVNDASRILTISGNATLNQDVSTGGSPTFVNGHFTTGLYLKDILSANELSFHTYGTELTADRALSINIGNVSRILTFSGNPTLGDWFDQSVKQAASPTFAEVITPAINSNTAQDTKLYEDLTIADVDPGNALYVYRKSVSEGTDYVKVFVDSSAQPNIDGSGTWYFLVNGSWASYLSPTLFWSRYDLKAGRDLFVVGDVGIGTATPTVALDVNGSMIVTDTTQLGGTTTNFTVEADGDSFWSGAGSGLSFAEIYVRDNTTNTTLNSAANVQVTVFDTDGESNNATPDHTNDHITIVKDGHYLATVSMSIHNVASQKHVVIVGLFKNNGTVEFNDIHADRTLTGGSTDIGSISITGIIDVSANDTIEVWATTSDAGDRAVDFDDINLSLVQIGG